MKKYIAVVAIAALVLAACDSGSATGTRTDSSITVAGEGRVTGTPDLLTVTLGVSVLRPTVGEATTAAAEAADRVIAALRGAGIADADMGTSDYSVWPEYNYNQDTPTVSGYRVQNTLSIKVRDLSASGEIIDTATAAGGDEAIVQGVYLSISDTSDLVVQARAQAWDNAVARAEQLAELGNVTLGRRPITITETYSPSVMPVPYAADMMAAGESSTPILPGTQEVVVTVQVTFPTGL